jgi:hypothetical protein
VRKVRVVEKKERKGKKSPVLLPLPPSFEDDSVVSYSRSALHRPPVREEKEEAMFVRGGERKLCRVDAEREERSVGRYEATKGGDARAEMGDEERDRLKRERSTEKRKTAVGRRKSRRVRPLRLPEVRSSLAARSFFPLELHLVLPDEKEREKSAARLRWRRRGSRRRNVEARRRVQRAK